LVDRLALQLQRLLGIARRHRCRVVLTSKAILLGTEMRRYQDLLMGFPWLLLARLNAIVPLWDLHMIRLASEGLLITGNHPPGRLIEPFVVIAARQGCLQEGSLAPELQPAQRASRRRNSIFSMR
jgi:hypothetical protein